jgi:hypothetical protein
MGWAGGERHGAFVGPHAGGLGVGTNGPSLSNASRAAIQRNLAWMEAHGLIREVTGHRRYRMWSLDN